MDTNWCGVCGRHTGGELYCSQQCANEDGASDAQNSWLDDVDRVIAQFSSISSTDVTPKSTPSNSPSSFPTNAWNYGVPASYANSRSSFSQPIPQVDLNPQPRSPPASLLAEIRQHRFVHVYRELPRRRGLPFYQELMAERTQARKGKSGNALQPQPLRLSASDATLFN